MKFPAIFRVLLASLAALLFLNSCTSDGGNAQLANTKWFDNEGTSHLEFSTYDICYYYKQSKAVCFGSYTYNASKKEVTFENFFLKGADGEGNTVTLVFSHAKIVSSGAKMQLYWHDQAEAEEHYILLTKI